MGNGTRSGFVASDKAAIECDVGLGLKTQRTESFPCNRMMGLPNLPYHHQPRPSSPSESCRGGFGGGGGGGPIFCNASDQVGYMNDISDVVGAASGAALPRTLHHFNTDTTFKPSGMAASLRVPFTAAQWQELDRQTIIYKHMMASVPVPPELLIPISKSLSDVAAASPSNLIKGCLGLGYSNGSDPEPWRCRRTDGKKWRCSRDVAPDQKYCERHAHKNRPRSRKPVEVHAHFTNNNNKTHSLNLPAETTKPYNHPKSHFINQTNHHISPLQTVVSATSYDQSRCSDWFLKGETAPGASPNQQWQQLMQSKVGMNKDSANLYQNVRVFQQQQEEEPINSSLATDQCNLLLGHKLGSLEGALSLEQTERPRDFIDAWSTAERDSIDELGNECSASSNAKLPISSLTLSMCGGNESIEENQHGQMGLGILDSERENEGGSVKPQPVLNWMSPGSWMGSPPGGPLAEALCLGITSTAKAASNAASPHGRSSTTTSSSSSSSKSSSGDSRQGLNLIK